MLIFTMPPMIGGTRLISRGMVIWDMVILERGYIKLDISPRVI